MFDLLSIWFAAGNFRMTFQGLKLTYPPPPTAEAVLSLRFGGRFKLKMLCIGWVAVGRVGVGWGGVGIYAVFTTVFKNYHLYCNAALCDTYKMEYLKKISFFSKSDPQPPPFSSLGQNFFFNARTLVVEISGLLIPVQQLLSSLIVISWWIIF